MALIEGGAKLSFAQKMSGMLGDNVVITPTTPSRIIRVHWVYFIPAAGAAADNLVTVKFNGTGGRTMYIGYALAHREALDGLPGQSVVVGLETNDPVAVTIHYQDIQP